MTLAGGTDGATGINTAAMLGQDVLPRKGMYALRKTGIDGFALCDVTDVTSWVAQATFGFSEPAYPVLTTAPGDTIASATASRVTNALDYFYAYLIMGDWPSFVDDSQANTQNPIVRQISPQAPVLGLLGNLSPEQSPLNKQINSIVATQRSIQQIPYGDAELQQANLGGIDLILPPAQSPGGFYFSMATGRNAWSTPGGNGIEFTRMNFFLIRSFNAVGGKFVGKLQSSRNDDPTRQTVWAAFEAFNRDLENPAIGSGGYGLIDSAKAQCDLLNNPLSLQSRGFLFVYETVRLLNVIRYFVIKLAANGSVQTTAQASPPSPAQFV